MTYLVSFTNNFKGYKMQLTTHGNTHFKGAAKNLAKELKRQGFEVSHSNALNIAAITLGYKNYNTYKAFNQDENDIAPVSLRDLQGIADRKIQRLYPSIKDKFVVFPRIQSQQFNALIYREEDEDKDLYYVVFEVKNNTTGRVFYSPEYDSILLFVYPDIQTGTNDYVINLNDMDSDKLFRSYFNDILHLLRTKDWAIPDLLQDIMELMEALVATRDNLREINKSKIINDDLESIFNKASEKA